VFVVDAQVERTGEGIVRATAEGVEVVGNIGDVAGVVVDATSNEDFAVGLDASVGQVDARADLVGALVDGRVVRGLGLAKVGLVAPVVVLVEGGVDGAASELGLVEVVGGGAEAVAASDLEPACARARGARTQASRSAARTGMGLGSRVGRETEACGPFILVILLRVFPV